MASEVSDSPDILMATQHTNMRCLFSEKAVCGGMAALLKDPTFVLGLLIWLVFITLIFIAIVTYMALHKKPRVVTKHYTYVKKPPPQIPPPTTYSAWIGSMKDDQVMEYRNPEVYVRPTKH